MNKKKNSSSMCPINMTENDSNELNNPFTSRRASANTHYTVNPSLSRGLFRNNNQDNSNVLLQKQQQATLV